MISIDLALIASSFIEYLLKIKNDLSVRSI